MSRAEITLVVVNEYLRELVCSQSNAGQELLHSFAPWRR